MSKHGQDYNETRSYGDGFQDGRRYERMESHRRASLLDPGEVYHGSRTSSVIYYTLAIVSAVVAALMIADAIWGPEAVTNFIASFFV